MIVLVCGGRYYDDTGKVWEVLDNLSIDLIVNGGADGADKLSSEWARDNGIQYCEFPALWTALAKKAGPIRNAAMLKYITPDLVVAFPGHKGTADMVERAEKLDITVRRIK